MQKKSKHFIKGLLIFFIIVACCIFTCIYILKEFIYPRAHFDIIKEEASKNSIDPYLILAIIKTESGFNKLATSQKNAKGLMQIMDSTAEEINNNAEVVEDINEANIYDENINIALGCKYFSDLVNKYEGNYYIAICAYNAGMGNVNKWLEQGIISKDLDNYKNIELPFNETQKYLKKVITSYKMYRLLYN